MPQPGDIAHALETWEEVGGGGAVAAVQLARLAGECTFLTALGDDELGERSRREAGPLGGPGGGPIPAGKPPRRALPFPPPPAGRTITGPGARPPPAPGAPPPR